MNKELLKTKIQDRGLLQQYVAKQLGLTRSGLSKKMNQTDFYAHEISILIDVLNLSTEEVYAIFFNREVDR